MAKRVYFAFHYQDVIDFRANVVRKHNFTGGVEVAGYYDYSIWEEAKRTNPTALKRMINSEIDGTSVTVVLIGSETYARRWVQYEIFRSIAKGNKLVGININSIRDKYERTKQVGPNPFDFLGADISHDGRTAAPVVWNGNSWVGYIDHDSWAIGQQMAAAFRGRRVQLSDFYKTYDWIGNDGFNNFGTWIS